MQVYVRNYLKAPKVVDRIGGILIEPGRTVSTDGSRLLLSNHVVGDFEAFVVPNPNKNEVFESEDYHTRSQHLTDENLRAFPAYERVIEPYERAEKGQFTILTQFFMAALTMLNKTREGLKKPRSSRDKSYAIDLSVVSGLDRCESEGSYQPPVLRLRDDQAAGCVVAVVPIGGVPPEEADEFSVPTTAFNIYYLLDFVRIASKASSSIIKVHYPMTAASPYPWLFETESGADACYLMPIVRL